MSQRQTWWITGASRGLGRALAERVAAAGHRVVASGRDLASLPTSDGIEPVELDVRDDARVRAVAADLTRRGGRLDVVVANAGYGLVGAVEECSDADLAAVLDTNVLGVARVFRAVLPVMRHQRSGHLVAISSTGGVGSVPLLGGYNASKWALEGLVEALAGEVAEAGVRVSLVEPGGIDTAWATSSMAFAQPSPAYDGLRTRLFGTSEVPWATEGTGGGTPPAEIAAAIVRHVTDPEDARLRVLAGDDAPDQVAAALRLRLADYARDPRFDPGAAVGAEA